MIDKKKPKGPKDASKINVEDVNELRYWCLRFDCSQEALRRAVRAAGVSPDKVEAYLKKK